MDEDAKEGLEVLVGLSKIGIAAIPVYGAVINEVINFAQATMLEKRLQNIEKVLRDHIDTLSVSYDEFVIHLKEFNEQEYYIVRSTFKHLVLSAEPDIVGPLCKSMVDFSLKIEQDVNQVVCEVISELNCHDIKLLTQIKDYLLSDEHKKEIDSLKIEAEYKNKQKGFKDRNVFYSRQTIIWRNFCKDFVSQNTEEKTIMPAFSAINSALVTEEGVLDYSLALEVISIVKMEKLGIVETEQGTTLGTSSHLNINRFHITVLGDKILDFL